MTSVRRSPCVVRDGAFVEPCSSLSAVVTASQGDKRNGVLQFAYVNMRDLKPSRSFYGIRTPGFPQGVAFNHCPFCGADISAPFATPAEKNASEIVAQ